MAGNRRSVVRNVRVTLRDLLGLVTQLLDSVSAGKGSLARTVTSVLVTTLAILIARDVTVTQRDLWPLTAITWDSVVARNWSLD